MVNEFGLSDMETAYWLGVQSWLLVIFGMLGAVLVDSYGVRRTALASLGVAVVSRALLTFGRSRHTLLFALLGLAPFGEAVLSTGIYTVALKKLTTPATRGFAFGVQCGGMAKVPTLASSPLKRPPTAPEDRPLPCATPVPLGPWPERRDLAAWMQKVALVPAQSHQSP